MASVFSSVDRTQAAPQQGLNSNLNTPEYYQQARSQVQGSSPQDPFGANLGFGTSVPPLPVDRSQNPLYNVGTGFNPPADANGPLGAAPDAGAIRRRLMGSIPGATDAAGLPYNAAFDTGVQNLYANEMTKLANYDQQQGDLQTAYEKNRDQTLQGQDLATKQLMDRLSFQGILNSGIATDQRALLGQRYAQTLDRAASAQAAALNRLQQQRLATQGEYQTKLGDLESTYSGNVVKWLQDQAQQEAARQQRQAQDQANADLLAQLQGYQSDTYSQMNQILQQMAGQAAMPALPATDENGNPIDWAAVAQAVANGMNLPPGWRPS